jgi:copper chaperone CopZ
VRRALEGLEGVDGVEVDLASGEAVVGVGGEMTNEELVKAVEGKVILSWARDLLAHTRLVDR